MKNHLIALQIGFGMRTYIIRRIVSGLLVLVIVSLMIFVAMRMLPGDPILIYISEEDLGSFTQEDVLLLKKKFGLI